MPRRRVGRALAISVDMTGDTPTLLAYMSQVVGWLPRHEMAVVDVRQGLALIEQHYAADALSRSDLLGFRAHVLRLNASPLRTILRQRVDQLGKGYGL